MAADPAQPTPTDTYISVRDRYIAEFNAHAPSEVVDPEHEHALAELSRLLSSIIPPWRSPGFPRKGKIGFETLDRRDLGFGTLDGLVYRRRDTEVLVTTPRLLRRWVADHNRWWQGSDDIPLPIDAALNSEPFWTYANFDDTRALLHGRVAAAIPGGTGVVLLAAYAQDVIGDAGPSHIVVAVLRGDRVFIARRKLTAATLPHPECERPLKQTLARAQKAGTMDLEERADRDYRACFAKHLREQPHYKAIVRQAQSLVDLLH